MKQYQQYLIIILAIIMYSMTVSAQRYINVRSGAFYIEGEVDRQIRPFNHLNASIAFLLKPYLNTKVDIGYGSYKSVADKRISTDMLIEDVYDDYQILDYWYPSFRFRYAYLEGSIEFMPLNFVLGHTDPLIEPSVSLGFGVSHHTTHLNLKDEAGMPYLLPMQGENAEDLYDSSFETKLDTDQGLSAFMSIHAALKIRLDYKVDLSLEAMGHLHKTDYLDGLSFDSEENDRVIIFQVGLEFEF